ncbi:MAG: peptide chain release factor N(5)-glutamine methyltransferase [Candidatus Omnitrophica bacterium]|nr:peptide chain release factor N(5)-glutamine methyltransferase [Candidatus Omnitrophota bacterium]
MNELELLFTEILGCCRHELYLKKDWKFTPSQREVFLDALKRRLKHEPLQYILGKTEFMGLEFKLNPHVFIPRPETELLVEYTLGLANCLLKRNRQLRILDLGTGSGCIAISLARYLSSKEVIIDATDVSYPALTVARDNASLNQVKINFLETNLFSGLKPQSYDIIVSNPPYIPSAEIEKLSKELSYEPRLALEGGEDGFKYLRLIIQDVPFYLKASGYLLLEIGYGQIKLLKNIFKNIKNLRIIDIIKDYSNIERVLVIKNHG